MDCDMEDGMGGGEMLMKRRHDMDGSGPRHHGAQEPQYDLGQTMGT